MLANMDDRDTGTEPVDPGKIRILAGQDPVKRRQILDGAQRVFMRMGYDAASMNDITREAGVSKSTIYVYFDNKDELFETLCEEHRNLMFTQITAMLEQPLSDRESLISYGITMVRLVTSDLVIRAQRTILGVTERKPEMGIRFYERGPKRGLMILQHYIEGLIAQGRIKVPDAQLATFQLGELFMAGISRQRLFGTMANEPSEAMLRKNVEAAVDMFFAAYGTDKADKS